MRSFLVIGAGTFGHHLCRELAALDCEVMVADISGETLEDLLPIVSAAKICDCTNIDVLKSFNVASFDACFVCVNRSFQACLEITDQLKELGAKTVYAKADRDLEAKFLRRCGADAVIYPERETAQRIAISESSDRIFDYIGLSADCSICEIEPPRQWLGRSIREVEPRVNHGLNLIAVRTEAALHPVLNPDYIFRAGEHIMVLGSMEAIRKIT